MGRSNSMMPSRVVLGETCLIEASAIPVFPEVGSMMVVIGVSLPSFSAASIRSFTLPSGLKNSAFNAILAPESPITRLRRMRGVRPTVRAIFL